jgi:integrase
VLATGTNPIEARRVGEARADATFGTFSDKLITELSHGFRSEKHKEQWRATLRLHASSLRDKRLDEITTEDVLGVLSPIWQTKHESASRLRGRIERILDAARARGLRTGENPARWRGHLDSLLAGRRRIAQAHYAAMPYPDVPGFVQVLRAHQGAAAVALEFGILTAARSAEILGARWDEMDLAARIWTLPPHRMKAGREHRVPLSKTAMDIVAQMQAIRTGDYVFPGLVPGRPLSVNALKKVLSGANVQGPTVHGFRSSFRDWAGECTAFPREVAEAALAHTVGDETERAYRRGDALEKRRLLMDAWAGFLAAPKVGGQVVPIGRAAR